MLKIIFFLLVTESSFSGYAFAQQNLKLWYQHPAKIWTEALPIGNGRLGAMVYGKVGEELIQINESTLWSGGPVKSNVNPDAPLYLPQIRKSLLEEDYQSAITLTKKLQGLYSESYLPLGDILIKQNFKDSMASEYYRELNLQDAVTTTKFTIDGNEFTREIFSTAPDQVIIIRLTSKDSAGLNFLVSLKSLLLNRTEMSSNDELVMKGKAPAHVDPSYYNVNKEPVIYEDTSGCNGMRYQIRMKILVKDGIVKADSSGLYVNNATEAILFLSAATSFNGFDKCPDKNGKDENVLTEQYLTQAIKKSYPQLLMDHIADYQKYFNRLTFTLEDSTANDNSSLSSDKRLEHYSKGGNDLGMETLYFQYGRYLLISSSRPGGAPANLQGIWNKELRAPWSSNYTININTQMNYWPAEETNLSEMHLPLFDLVKHLSITGAVTAKQFYNLKGWVAHHNSDIWALSNPVGDKGGGDPRWANWTQGGNWLCQHLWEHYLFTGDKEFLKDSAYAIMKGAGIFCLNWLTEDKNGFLVSAPSVSPENTFRYGQDKVSDVSVATTMDMSIIWDLFTNLIDASTVLDCDKDFRNELIAKKKKLFPLHIGKRGNLQEWDRDWEDVEVQHRHISHLFGLYPGRQISPLRTPAFAKAAKKSLEIRGDAGTGWSKAWKINFWARLLDGDHAYLLIRQLLHYSTEFDTTIYEGGGTYANFFDAHPPFQIDGNFGGTAGMAEMLLQSHLGEIHLLPALPHAWKGGKITGLKARGGMEVSLEWKNHRLTKSTLKALYGGICKIRTDVRVRIDGISTEGQVTKHGFLLSFQTEKGKTYHLSAL